MRYTNFNLTELGDLATKITGQQKYVDGFAVEFKFDNNFGVDCTKNKWALNNLDLDLWHLLVFQCDDEGYDIHLDPELLPPKYRNLSFLTTEQAIQVLKEVQAFDKDMVIKQECFNKIFDAFMDANRAIAELNCIYRKLNIDVFNVNVIIQEMSKLGEYLDLNIDRRNLK